MVTARYSDQQGSNRDKTFCDSTSNGTDQCQNGSSTLLASYRGQSRSTRIVVAYPRPAFSATKRTNDAPISFDQQVQVSQGHTSYRNKENCSTDVYVGGGLKLVKPAREPASSRPKPCASLRKLRESCPLAALCGPRRKQKDRGQTSAFPSETSRFTPFDSRAQGFSTPLANHTAAASQPTD